MQVDPASWVISPEEDGQGEITISVLAVRDEQGKLQRVAGLIIRSACIYIHACMHAFM